jgi:hypothetical protein
VSINSWLRHSFELTPASLNATCSSITTPDMAQVTEPPALYCDVPGPAAELVCEGSAPTGFVSCIAKAGMNSCPSGTPFTTPYTVEADVKLECSTCSPCTTNPACSSGTVTFYGDANTCANVLGSLPAVTCSGMSSHPWSSVAAVKYSATGAATCTGGTSTASTTLVNPTTLCCR